MNIGPYVMLDQTRDKVRDIMRETRSPALVTRPSWLALALLVAAFNVIAISST